MTKPKPNKQAELTAASFKRLAKDARKIGRDMEEFAGFRAAFTAFGVCLDREAARVRRKP